jgi:signal peptidase II
MKKSLSKFLILIAILVSGCSLDLKTKDLAKSALKDHSVSVINNYFDLRYVENHAIVFGLLNDISKNVRIPLIFMLTISATFLGFYLIWRIREHNFRFLLPFFIIIGGACGNILDRGFNGYVTDFFHFHYFSQYHFYVFNVADVLVNIGLFLIIIQWRSFESLFNEVFTKNRELPE